MDVQGSGWHLGTAKQELARASMLLRRVASEILQLIAIGALPSGFRRKLHILGVKSVPAALHGIDTSSTFRSHCLHRGVLVGSAAWSTRVPTALWAEPSCLC